MERLKKMFKNTNQVLKNSDVDAVILNCGDKGSGKSSLDLWGGCYWEEELNQRQFTLDNTVYDPKAFLGRLHNASPYSLITGDEGIEIFFSRNAMTGANKKLAKAMAQARAGKNYLIMINIPDIRMVEGYIRTGEATAVIRTVMKWCPEENRLLKGYVDVYNAEDIPKIKFDHDKGVIWPEASFIDTFPDIKKERPQLWRAYLDYSVTHKKANRQTDLTDWGKKPIKPAEIKKDLEIDYFIWQNRKGRNKMPYETLVKQIKKKFNKQISHEGARYKFEHYHK